MSISGNHIPDNSILKYIPFADKIVHAVLFAVFVILLNNSFLKQYNNYKHRYYVVLTATMIAIFYAGLTELLQEILFIKRSADIMDFIADLSGIIVASLLFIKIKKL